MLFAHSDVAVSLILCLITSACVWIEFAIFCVILSMSFKSWWYADIWYALENISSSLNNIAWKRTVIQESCVLCTHSAINSDESAHIMCVKIILISHLETTLKTAMYYDEEPECSKIGVKWMTFCCFPANDALTARNKFFNVLLNCIYCLIFWRWYYPLPELSDASVILNLLSFSCLVKKMS